MDLKTENITIPVDDGTSMQCYVARPAGTPTRGIIIGQEAFGVNAHIREVTERFARQGFLAIAPEVFHRTAPPGFEGRYDDFPSLAPHFQGLTDAGMTADMRAAHNWLASSAKGGDFKIAVVGFCLGGRLAFLSALTLPVACAVSFYGGNIAPSPRGPGLLNRTGEINAPLLFFWGGKDKHLGPDQVQAVTKALRDAGKYFINVEISDADHGFFCDARSTFNPVAAKLAWPLVMEFLNTHTQRS